MEYQGYPRYQDQDWYFVFYAFTCVSFFVHLFSTFVDLCQIKKIQSSRFTDDLGTLFQTNEKSFNESKSYSLETMKTSLIFEWIDFIYKIMFIYCGMYERTLSWVEMNTSFISLPFYFQVALSSSIQINIHYFLIDLFKTWYYTFIIEERYHFNNTTRTIFILDCVKTFLIQNTILLLLIPMILYPIDYFEIKLIFIWIFVFSVGFQILMTFLYPVLIEPLFNKLVPLESGQLKQKIIELSHSVSFVSPVDHIFTIDNSKRSNHENVYVTGLFGKKRIVIFDSLLNNATQDETSETDVSLIKKYKDDEILSIVAHELGHWVNNDIYWQFLLSIVFGLCEKMAQQYFISDDLIEILISSKYAMLLALISSPFSIIQTLIHNWFSRRCETNADTFSCQKGYSSSLQSALVKLNKSNKSMQIEHYWLYSLFHHSHPTLIERLDHIKSLKKFE